MTIRSNEFELWNRSRTKARAVYCRRQMNTYFNRNK